ncbi:MAG TPA: multicopper oxidase domain-containing protein [Actinomycetota bacterium]|jgi:FtsP/CotA-like multicopper oxidase with cupredoxin domain|nr:multicopper oxidase domain-containing protein [Actinomycetota bacterium]
MVLTAPERRTAVESPPSAPNYSRLLRSDLWRTFVTLGVIFAVVVSMIAVLGRDNTGASGAEGVLEVELSELKIEPAVLKADAGAPINIEVHNNGTTSHNLAVTGHGGTDLLVPGGETTLSLGPLPAGSYEMFCEIAGHKDGGMKGELIVGGGGPAGGASAMSSDQMDTSYLNGVKAFPAKTKGLGGRRLEPRIVGGVKVFELTANETKWEVAPGDVRDAMAYNGQVPGPEIRVKEGERVRIVVHNELEESTSIHFHGLMVPNDQDGVPGLTEDITKPGGTHTYDFTVPNAGTNIYHSHMNGAKQIPMGLWGAFIVEGRNEPAVDQDVNMILNDGPLGFTINGKGFPATQPIVAAPGERVRIRYMNEGLQGHPMHLHGMEQLVIAKDGWALPQPYRADTIWVAPGERYDVIVTTRPGAWAFHCHILSHAEGEQGMFGMVTALVVK